MKQPTGQKWSGWFWVELILLSLSTLFWLTLQKILKGSIIAPLFCYIQMSPLFASFLLEDH
jgi:hypothetical protein